MALPKDFKFSDFPAVQAEAERRAVVVFGADWHCVCSEAKDRIGSRAISAHDNFMSCDDDQIRTLKLGNLHDLPDGSPAFCQYNADGLLSHCVHYREGRISAPDDGSPAGIEYYPSGAVKSIDYYRNGQFSDLPDGTPAAVYFSEAGEIFGGKSSAIGRLSVGETIERLKEAKVHRIENLLANADQAVVPAGMPLPESHTQSTTDGTSKAGR